MVEGGPQSEITVETARSDASYTEVEESEADLERFETWLTALTAGVCFQAPACSIRGALECHDARITEHQAGNELVITPARVVCCRIPAR